MGRKRERKMVREREKDDKRQKKVEREREKDG